MASAAFEEIVETFDFLDDWEERYGHVIDLGKALPPLNDALRVPATKVDGCASQVWIHTNIEGQGGTAILHFVGDSDAMIVRGLIAILEALYNGQTVDEVQKIDAQGELTRLGLNDHLSAQRSNGLRSMVARLQEVAARAA